jgi:hypothetical protein
LQANYEEIEKEASGHMQRFNRLETYAGIRDFTCTLCPACRTPW